MIEIIVTSTWSGLRGVVVYTEPHACVWLSANRSSRILNFLQNFMFCRSIVITSAPSGGNSSNQIRCLTQTRYSDPELTFVISAKRTKLPGLENLGILDRRQPIAERGHPGTRRSTLARGKQITPLVSPSLFPDSNI
jgi:hypothetical protein